MTIGMVNVTLLIVLVVHTEGGPSITHLAQMGIYRLGEVSMAGLQVAPLFHHHIQAREFTYANNFVVGVIHLAKCLNIPAHN
jgi:hypothetical protein